MMAELVVTLPMMGPVMQPTRAKYWPTSCAWMLDSSL
jgi:hypothetical protein